MKTRNVSNLENVAKHFTLMVKFYQMNLHAWTYANLIQNVLGWHTSLTQVIASSIRIALSWILSIVQIVCQVSLIVFLMIQSVLSMVSVMELFIIHNHQLQLKSVFKFVTQQPHVDGSPLKQMHFNALFWKLVQPLINPVRNASQEKGDVSAHPLQQQQLVALQD